MQAEIHHPVVHPTMESALRDLKKRCKYPESVVFDIDGTLLIGKTQVASLCKYYRTLCGQCAVTIVTARSVKMHGDTINQLKKNQLDCFTEICMRDQDSEEDFKINSLRRLNPDIAIGNRWHDLNLGDILSLPDDVYIVGDKWIKVPR
jgi:hypothetical protein